MPPYVACIYYKRYHVYPAKCVKFLALTRISLLSEPSSMSKTSIGLPYTGDGGYDRILSPVFKPISAGVRISSIMACETKLKYVSGSRSRVHALKFVLYAGIISIWRPPCFSSPVFCPSTVYPEPTNHRYLVNHYNEWTQMNRNIVSIRTRHATNCLTTPSCTQIPSSHCCPGTTT